MMRHALAVALWRLDQVCHFLWVPHKTICDLADISIGLSREAWALNNVPDTRLRRVADRIFNGE